MRVPTRIAAVLRVVVEGTDGGGAIFSSSEKSGAIVVGEYVPPGRGTNGDPIVDIAIGDVGDSSPVCGDGGVGRAAPHVVRCPGDACCPATERGVAVCVGVPGVLVGVVVWFGGVWIGVGAACG